MVTGDGEDNMEVMPFVVMKSRYGFKGGEQVFLVWEKHRAVLYHDTNR